MITWLFWVLLSLCAVFIEYAVYESLFVPQLCLGLAAWAMINGEDKDYILRCACLGLFQDLIDPASHYFHVLFYSFMALLAFPMRRYLGRFSPLAWMLWFLVLSCALVLVDGPSLAPRGLTLLGNITLIALTIGLFCSLGMACRRIPSAYHPLAQS